MTAQDFKDEVIWLIGASSGIGASLATELATRGARLILSARRADALHELAASLPAPDTHWFIPLDVGDFDQLASVVADLKTKVPRLNRAIFLAATYQPGQTMDMPLDDIARVIHVNFTAAFAILQAVVPWMRDTGGGQIALTASVAGYRGLPGGQPYSATKAALINLAESLQVELAPQGIDIRVINPGFVRTPLTDKNNFHMPMRMEPDAAARALAHGLKGRRFEINFPSLFCLMMKIIRILPNALYLKMAASIGRKVPNPKS